MECPLKGTLYVVSTPIGNLKDITFRAVEVLNEVDLVAAEDTRHSRKLFSKYGIKTRLTSYYGAKEEIKGEEVLKELRRGKKVALISDAGTPGISDPGYFLIKNAAQEGHEVISIPGASALVSALTISGLPTARFVFEGFLPPKAGARKKRLEFLKNEERTIVFYESPGRTLKTLPDMLEIFGDRKAALARELTKIHEEVVRGNISDIIEYFGENRVRGEVAIIVTGSSGLEPGSERDEGQEFDLHALLEEAIEKGVSMKDASEDIARKFNLSKRDVYQEMLGIKEKRIKK